jgi:hypothetical protein
LGYSIAGIEQPRSAASIRGFGRIQPGKESSGKIVRQQSATLTNLRRCDFLARPQWGADGVRDGLRALVVERLGKRTRFG